MIDLTSELFLKYFKLICQFETHPKFPSWKADGYIPCLYHLIMRKCTQATWHSNCENGVDTHSSQIELCRVAEASGAVFRKANRTFYTPRHYCCRTFREPHNQ